MEKGHVTSIGMLSAGDRFYFASDKQKTVYQVQPLKAGQGNTWKFKGRIFHADIEVRTDAGVKKYCKQSTQVVFLRSTNEQTKQTAGGLAG